MSIEGAYPTTPGQTSLQVGQATHAYQSILDEIQVALPNDGIRATLAQTALHNIHAYTHQIRVYSHGKALINDFRNAGLISQEEAIQSTDQFISAPLHDLGKHAVADTLPGSDRVMHGTVYDATRDLRTPKQQSDMARHAMAGGFATEVLAKKGSLLGVPDNTVKTIQEGQQEHHATPTPVVSMRGVKISYMHPVFTPSPYMRTT